MTPGQRALADRRRSADQQRIVGARVPEERRVKDGDFTEAGFREAYQANLANGLGNLVSRVMKMSETNLKISNDEFLISNFDPEYSQYIEKFELNRAMDWVWGRIGELDKKIEETKPFLLVKTDPEAARKIIAELVQGLAEVAWHLRPFLPETAEKIQAAIKENKLDKSLFPRLE